jgi:energy-coupling factor transporter transmembrane protein EcfT
MTPFVCLISRHKVIGYIGGIGVIVLTILIYSYQRYWICSLFLLLIMLPFICLVSRHDLKSFFIRLSVYCSYLGFLYFTNFTYDKKLYALYKHIEPNMRFEEFETLKEYYFPNEEINKVLKKKETKYPNKKKTNYFIYDAKEGDNVISYWIRQNIKRVTVDPVGDPIEPYRDKGYELRLHVNKGIIRSYYYAIYHDIYGLN